MADSSRVKFNQMIASFEANPLDSFNSIEDVVKTFDTFLDEIAFKPLSEKELDTAKGEVLSSAAKVSISMANAISSLYDKEQIDTDTTVAAAKTLWTFSDYFNDKITNEGINVRKGKEFLHRAAGILVASVNNAIAIKGIHLTQDDDTWLRDAIDKSPDVAPYGQVTRSYSDILIKENKPSPFANAPKINIHPQKEKASISTNSLPLIHAETNNLPNMVKALSDEIEEYKKKPLKHIDDLDDLTIEVKEFINAMNNDEAAFTQKNEFIQKIFTCIVDMFDTMFQRVRKRYINTDDSVFATEQDKFRIQFAQITNNAMNIMLAGLEIRETYPRINQSILHLLQIADLSLYSARKNYFDQSTHDVLKVTARMDTLLARSADIVSSLWEDLDMPDVPKCTFELSEEMKRNMSILGSLHDDEQEMLKDSIERIREEQIEEYGYAGFDIDD